MAKRRRATRAQEKALDRLEYLVLRDHGHEWEETTFQAGEVSFVYNRCRFCFKEKYAYQRGSRAVSAHQESGCVYTDT